MRMCVSNICKFSIRIHVCEVFYVSCNYLFVYLLELMGCVPLVCCAACLFSRMLTVLGIWCELCCEDSELNLFSYTADG
jgi:hypothetical protein